MFQWEDLKIGKLRRSLANRSHQFRYRHVGKKNQLIIPQTTSENRKYLPIGFLDKKIVIQQSAQVVYDSETYILSVISSKMHMLWLNSIGGKQGKSTRYSPLITYNTFPFPILSKQRKEELTQCTLKIIDERLKHSEKTLAELYDPVKMPKGLKEAHYQNDLAVEKCYRSNPFSNDEERLEYLFKLYETMIQEEKDSGTLFAKEKKTRKRR